MVYITGLVILASKTQTLTIAVIQHLRCRKCQKISIILQMTSVAMLYFFIMDSNISLQTNMNTKFGYLCITITTMNVKCKK